MKKNTCKSDSELAWEFIWAELARQYHEPQAILARLAGNAAYEPSSS
ncbi:MAG: hypothetical protein PHV74_09205 [Dehalococcoidia bacterium]|nr:hypothetical protein [Dehalococcoidia bacterium]